MKRVFIIAEAGVNHNGDIRLAKRMVDAAVYIGVDAVKFQTFKAENVSTKYAQMAVYQKKNTGRSESQFEMAKRLELSHEAFLELDSYCKKKKIIFMSTPFDIESVNFLDKLGLKIFKIPSGEIINLPYLREVGSLKKKIIMSTGMADLKEVRNAIDILVKAGTRKRDITILHCNTEYPSPVKDVNLLAMITMRDRLKVKIGYSDHTLGIEIPVAAVALGAEVIEKHFTLDKNMKGPDHKASLEPDEFKLMITAIRNTEKAFGSRVKKASPSELKNRKIVRKSIVASRFISKGETFNENNIAAKKTIAGISPMKWDKVIGRISARNFKKDELIKL